MASATLYNRVCSFFSRWRKKRNDLRDIAAIESFEFSDLGMCRSDLVNFASGPRDIRDRIEGMTGRLGLDYAEVMGPRWRAVEIARNCTNCGERRTCGKYLRGNGARDDYETFCPNARTFAGLLDENRPVH